MVELTYREIDIAAVERAVQSPACGGIVTFVGRVREQSRGRSVQYLEYEASILYKRGVHPKPWTYMSQPLREFWRRYVTLRGYRDGFCGLLLCLLVAYYYGFRVTVRLAQLRHQDKLNK